MFRNGAVVVRDVVLKRATCFVLNRVLVPPFVRRSSSTISSKHPPSFINTKAPSSVSDETDESSDEEGHHNKTPYPTIDLAKWVDTTVTALNGKVFPAPKAVIASKKAAPFPIQPCSSLLDDSMVNVPHDIDAEIKVVMFSFRHYGFSLLRSWMNELEDEANFKKYTKRPKTGSSAIPAPSYKVIEICYVETGILSIAKHLTAKNLRSKMEQHRLPLAFVKYGGIMDLALQLSLPNIYTGYVYVLDRENKVRWKASGEPTQKEIKSIFEAFQQLQEESISKRKEGR